MFLGVFTEKIIFDLTVFDSRMNLFIIRHAKDDVVVVLSVLRLCSLWISYDFEQSLEGNVYGFEGFE